MKRKVKYRNYDHTLTVALLGDYIQNIPKPKHTQVKTYRSGVKIYSSQVKTYSSGVKTYPVCSQNVPLRKIKLLLMKKCILDTLKYLSIIIKICFIYKIKYNKHQYI